MTAIEPEDIRVGDRVSYTDYPAEGDPTVFEFTVTKLNEPYIPIQGHFVGLSYEPQHNDDCRGTWELISRPSPKLGSLWRDPEDLQDTNVWVFIGHGQYARPVPTPARARLEPGYPKDDRVIARLVPEATE